MKPLALVLGFGMLGVLLRYALGMLSLKFFPSSGPLTTLTINVSGSFLMGLVYVMGVERSGLSPELRTALAVGFLGGFTTFSAYCMEALKLLESGELTLALLYAVGSPALGMLACYGGLILARMLEKI